MYHQQSFHLTIHQLLKSCSGSSFMQKISRHNYSIKIFIPLNGLCVSQKRGIQTAPCINTILPLLRDKVSTFNMQVHLMQLKMKCTAVLNPGQTQVCWYALLPKNSSFVTQKFFLNIFPSSDNFNWAIVIDNSWTVDRGFRSSINSYWKQIIRDRTFCSRRRE